VATRTMVWVSESVPWRLGGWGGGGVNDSCSGVRTAGEVLERVSRLGARRWG
jgi:hypothetical protein